MNRIGNIAIKDVQVSFQQTSNELQPCYYFQIELRTTLSTQDINLYYNTVSFEWFGDKIAYGEWIDCEQEEIEELKQFLFKLDFIVVSESFYAEFYEIHPNYNETFNFIFLVLGKNKYIVLDVNDIWIEEFPMLYQALKCVNKKLNRVNVDNITLIKRLILLKA